MKKFIGYTLLIIGAISMLLPFVYMIALSFMTDKQIFSQNLNFIPSPATIGNYIYVFTHSDIPRYFVNSMIVASITTIGQVFISSLAGYAFARFRFPFREPLFFLIIVSMMIPPQVNIVPLFFLMKTLHWLDTYYALTVPGFFGGFGVFLMRQWFKSMPSDTEASAKIDGCNAFQVFYKIALPTATPALATLAIFTFITAWNGFLWPLIVTDSDSLMTLPLALAKFKGSFREITDWGALTAFSVICSVPVIIIFLAGRKYFINDVLSGGLKE